MSDSRPACPHCETGRLRPAVHGWYCHECLTRGETDDGDDSEQAGRRGLAGELVKADASEVIGK